MKRIIQTTLFLLLALLSPATAQDHVANGIHHIKGPLTPTTIHNSHAGQPKVMISPTLTQQLTASAMKGTIRAFDAERNLMQQAFNHAGNRLMDKVPRRLTANDVTGNKLVFAIENEFGKPTSSNFMAGGHSATVTEVSPGVLSVYYIYGSYYAIPVSTTINVDYNTKSAELIVGTVASFQWSNTVENTTYDTTQYVMVLNEDYLLNYPNGSPTNIAGTINDNGSIHFNDGFCYYIIDYCTKTKNGNVTCDTISFVSNTYRDTYLMTPNGKHQHDEQLDYDINNQIDTVYTTENDVYMYQADDTTAVIWNMWGLGNRGLMMFIHENGKMEFPSMQIVFTPDPTHGFSEFDDLYIYSNEMHNYAVELPPGTNYMDFSGQFSTESSFGSVTPTEITWGANMIFGEICNIGDSTWYPGFYLTNFILNNKLTFTDGSRWFDKQDESEEDVLYYSYNYSNGTATVIASDTPYSGDINIPENTLHDGKTYTVTAVGDSAFYDCTELNSIHIGNSVTSIGSYAFTGCTGMTRISIGNSVTSIGYNAFNKCKGLTRVDITDLEAWCRITFENKYYEHGHSIGLTSNPCYYAHHLFLNDVEITNLVIPSSITSINQVTFIGCSQLTRVTIPNSVTSIGSYAFSDCSGLTNMTIPSSVTSIGSSAFYKCTGLTNINLPNSITKIEYGTFENCSGLTSIVVPNSVTYIGQNAFNSCSGLESVYIGNSVRTIETYAFEECTSLNKVEISSIESWCQISFNTTYHDNNFILSSNPLYLAHHLFLNGTEITDLVIPNTISLVSNYAFGGCEGITNLSIPNSITSIGKGAFGECINLTNVHLPDSITTIPEDCFFGCSKLTSINIPSTVISINEDAFIGCDNISHIYLTDLEAWCNIEIINEWFPHPFNPFTHPHHLYLNGEEIKDLVIPNAITSININNFQYCSWLTSIYIPRSVSSIDNGAFKGCSGLTTIFVDGANTVYDSRNNCNAVIESSSNTLITGCMNTVIPNSVTAVGKEAFYGCSGLTSIRIPSSVTSIGNWAFSGCTSLTDVYCYIPNPSTVTTDKYTFPANSYPGRTLHVLQGTAGAYQADENWYPYFKQILDDLIPDIQGDVNGDGNITISDVTTLIDLLLSSGEITAGADVNGDGAVSIKDVTDLIDMLLSGN